MTSLYGQLRLRPTRIGFLVRPTDMSNIRRIMRLNTGLWGGAFNPIIPVCHTLPACWKREPTDVLTGRELADGYLEFFQPDVFVETSPGQADKCGINDSRRLVSRQRVVGIDDFVITEEGRCTEFAFGLSVFDVYQKLYQEEFQFVSQHDRRVTLVEGKSAQMSFFEVISGGFPVDKSLAFIRNAYVDIFKPEIAKPDVDAMMRVIQRQVNTAIGFTKYGLEQHTRGFWDEPSIFVVDPKSPTDIVDLWNLRLYRSNVIPISVQWLDECQDFLRDFVSRNHRSVPRNPRGVMIRTTVELARSLDHAVVANSVKEILSGLPNGSWVLKMWYDPIWRRQRSDGVSRTVLARIEARSTDLDLTVDEKLPSIRFRSISPEFAERFGGPAARWVNVLSVKDFGRASKWALTFPSTTKSDTYPGHQVGDSMLITREGFVLRQRYKDSREHIGLISGRDAITRWLKDRSIDAKPSEPGRITDQIISAVDGFWRSDILAHKETLKLLDKMSKSVRTFADSETIEEYPDRTASVGEWRELLGRREAESVWRRSGIDDFVNAGALKLGLEIGCPNCEKKNWYGISEVSERVKCERCLKEYDFPQGTLGFSKTPWRFRLAGPFTVPDFAGGAYATVLALRCLIRGLGTGDQSVTYSTNLDLEFNNQLVEIDFACWYRKDWIGGDREEPVFVVGEAKSFAQEAFTDRDIRRMKKIAEQIPGTVFVLAVLKESLSAEEKLRIRRLANWGRYDLPDGRQRAPIVILTGTELFADHDVRNAWEQAGGLRKKLITPGYVHLDNLTTLADFTQQAYLGLPSYWMWLDNRYKKKAKKKPAASIQGKRKRKTRKVARKKKRVRNGQPKRL